MSQRKVTIPINGKPTPCTDVGFKTLPDKPEVAFEYELEDGTVLRVKFAVTAFLRIDGQHDADGNPKYLVRNGFNAVVIDADEKMRAKTPAPSKDDPSPTTH